MRSKLSSTRFAAAARAARPAATLVGFVGVFHLLLVAVRVLKYGELSGRYVAILAVLTIPWAAEGFVHLVRLAIARSSDPSRLKYIPIWASGLMIALFPLVFYGVRPINPGRLMLREAGTWLRNESSRGDVILADANNLSQVRYYADRLYPRRNDWEQLDRDSDDVKRREAIERIRPRWIVAMIDEPHNKVDAKALAKALCEQLLGYEVAEVFDTDARPVIVLRRAP